MSVSTNIHDNLGTIDIVSSPFLNLTQWTSTVSLLQTTKRLNRTIIASNNKANEVSTVLSEPIVPSLSSTLFVAHTKTNEIVNNALSTSVPPEKLATKHSSLNMQSVFFRTKEHSSAISSKASVLKPEIALTTSEFSGIILPSSSVDKKYLPTSQAGDNANGYSSQGALAKSAFSNGFNSQTGQFSSSNSILGRISDYYDVSASTNDGSRLFTKGSMSLIKLPRTFLLSSQTIWKTTDLNPRTHETTLLFSNKADTSNSWSHATPTSDTKPSASTTTRKFPSISGMSQATLVAKMTQDSDVALATFLMSRTTQMVTSSLVHSEIQRDTSLVSSVVMPSPSMSSKARKVSSLSSSAAMTVSITPMIHQAVPSRINSKLSSRPENEFRTLTNSDEKESSRQMSFTTMYSSRIIAWDSSTRDSASISLDESALSVTQGMKSSLVSTLAKKTTRSAVSSLQTQSLHSRTREVNLEMSFADSTKTFVSRTSPYVSPPLQATENLTSLFLSSLKAKDVTEFLTQSIVQPTNWIPFSASEEFSALSTDKNRETWISWSSTLPQMRSSAVSDDSQNLRPSLRSTSALLDKSKLQTSSAVSATSPKSEITSGVIVSTFY